MRAHKFQLVTEVVPFVDGPAPEEINVPLKGHKATVKKGDTLRQGALLAEHPDPKRGDRHAPFDGEVTKVSPLAVTVKRKNLDAVSPAEGEEAKTTTPREAVHKELGGLAGAELAAALKSLGFGTLYLPPRGARLVINALPPEPGILWAGELLDKHAEEIRAGIDLLKRLLEPAQLYIVLPEGSKADLGGEVRRCEVKPNYPESVEALVIKAATGQESPEDAGAVGLHRVWRLGRAALSGRPLSETVVTVQDKNYLVVPGTGLREILAHAGVTLRDSDYLILGGLMRGTSVSDPEQPLPAHAIGLFHVPGDKYAKVRENPCINCGACVQFCPSRLMANVIGRNAEFQNYDECKNLSVTACMECGLCGYYCIARRPMLQYMREAKGAIALQERTLQMQP